MQKEKYVEDFLGKINGLVTSKVVVTMKKCVCIL